MLKNALKSTSVLAICAGLMVPPAYAQNGGGNTEGLEACETAEGPFPCVIDDKRIRNTKQFNRAMNAADDMADEAAEAAPGGEPADGGQPVEETADMDPSQPAEAGAAAEADAAVEAEADNLADALPADDAAEEPVEAAPAEAAPVAEEEVVEAPAEPAAEEDQGLVQNLVDQLTGDDEEADADVAADAEVEADAEADMAAEAEAEAPVAEEEAAEDMTAGERIEEDTSAETAQAPAAEEAPEEEQSLIENLADSLTGDDQDAEVAAEAEAEAAAEGEAQMTEAPVITEEPVEDEAPVAAAAAADAEAEDATAEDMAADEDVVVEEVTEADARSSDEEFDTKVTAAAEARGNGTRNTETGGARANNNNGNGILGRDLTDFEKMVLVGLGGVAVGTILANGDEIVSNSGDRIVVQNPDGTYQVLKNDDVILRQPGAVVSTKSFDDGSTRTVVERPNGVRIVTLRAADGTVLKRTRVLPDGTRVVLFDDTQAAQPVSQRDVASYEPAPVTEVSGADEAALREALMASMNAQVDRSFSLRQVRTYKQIRDLAPIVEVDAITFDTGSSVIKASQAEELAALGLAIRDVIEEVPNAVFLIEGHTDAVGNAGYNLALSDRRAESVALALTEYFDVPPENLITQGYGESELKISTLDAERQNRRANVRNITPLLQ